MMEEPDPTIKEIAEYFGLDYFYDDYQDIWIVVKYGQDSFFWRSDDGKPAFFEELRRWM